MGDVGEDVDEYLLDEEEVTYSFSHRPTGFLNWLKSLLGYGMSQWYITKGRLIVYRNVAGGFDFREIPLKNVTSVAYGRRLDLQLLAVGILTTPLLVGFLIILYALFQRQQVLEVHVSGGEKLSVIISKGSEIDEFLWYLPAQRKIDAVSN